MVCKNPSKNCFIFRIHYYFYVCILCCNVQKIHKYKNYYKISKNEFDNNFFFIKTKKFTDFQLKHNFFFITILIHSKCAFKLNYNKIYVTVDIN